MSRLAVCECLYPVDRQKGRCVWGNDLPPFALTVARLNRCNGVCGEILLSFLQECFVATFLGARHCFAYEEKFMEGTFGGSCESLFYFVMLLSHSGFVCVLITVRNIAYFAKTCFSCQIIISLRY